MNYLVQRETNGQNTLAYKYTESEDEFIESLSEPGLETLPCHDIHDGIQLLRNKHDHGLNNDLSFVLDKSDCRYEQEFVRVSTLIPYVQKPVDYMRLTELCKEHGRIKCSTRNYLTNPPSDSALTVCGLFSTGWGDDEIFEYSPSKIKRRANQGKYYKRGRMRNGDVPIDIFRWLLSAMEDYLIEARLPHYQSGSGSTHGACENFKRLYKAMEETTLLSQMRNYYRSLGPHNNRWLDRVEDASHYIVGCKEKKTHPRFAMYIELECEALEIPIPTYKKGQKYE